MEQVNEEWKDIEGYEGLYQASDLGRIRSLHRITTRKNSNKPFIVEGKIISLDSNSSDYTIVNLYKNQKGKHLLVHRLVGKAFIENPNNLKTINHKNGIKKDNRRINLEWSSHSDNMKHSFRELNRVPNNLGKFGKEHNSSKCLLQLDLEGNIIKEWESISIASKTLNISSSSISVYCNGKGVKPNYKGFIWKYKSDINTSVDKPKSSLISID